INSCYSPYIENKYLLEEDIIIEKKDSIKKTNKELIEEKYIEELSKYKFSINKFVNNGFSIGQICSTNDKRLLRAIGKECSSFDKNLPIHYSSSVLARIDSSNSRCMRVLITGPRDTPYDSGIYIFDVYIVDNFPNNNP